MLCEVFRRGPYWACSYGVRQGLRNIPEVKCDRLLSIAFLPGGVLEAYLWKGCVQSGRVNKGGAAGTGVDPAPQGLSYNLLE